MQLFSLGMKGNVILIDVATVCTVAALSDTVTTVQRDYYLHLDDFQIICVTFIRANFVSR